MSKMAWGRKETIIWPQNRPIYTYAAIFSAMILTVVFVFGCTQLQPSRTKVRILSAHYLRGS